MHILFISRCFVHIGYRRLTSTVLLLPTLYISNLKWVKGTNGIFDHLEAWIEISGCLSGNPNVKNGTLWNEKIIFFFIFSSFLFSFPRKRIQTLQIGFCKKRTRAPHNPLDMRMRAAATTTVQQTNPKDRRLFFFMWLLGMCSRSNYSCQHASLAQND